MLRISLVLSLIVAGLAPVSAQELPAKSPFRTGIVTDVRTGTYQGECHLTYYSATWGGRKHLLYDPMECTGKPKNHFNMAVPAGESPLNEHGVREARHFRIDRTTGRITLY